MFFWGISRTSYERDGMHYKSSAAFYELLFGVARRFRPAEIRRDWVGEGRERKSPAFCNTYRVNNGKNTLVTTTARTYCEYYFYYYHYRQLEKLNEPGWCVNSAYIFKCHYVFPLKIRFFCHIVFISRKPFGLSTLVLGQNFR